MQIEAYLGITSHKKYVEGITLSFYYFITSDGILTTEANVINLS